MNWDFWDGVRSNMGQNIEGRSTRLVKRPGARRCRTTHTRPLHQIAGLPVGSAERKNIRIETEYKPDPAASHGRASATIWCWRRWNKCSAYSQSITDRVQRDG